MEWLAAGGRPFQTCDLDPAFFVLLKLEQRLERGIVEAFGGERGPHVVDDVAGRQRAQDRRKFADAARLEIDVDVPAKFGDAMNDAVELRHVADAAEPLEEREAAA